MKQSEKKILHQKSFVPCSALSLDYFGCHDKKEDVSKERCFSSCHERGTKKKFPEELKSKSP